jgi:DNA (cytosine-5)-methyltransferase 1
MARIIGEVQPRYAFVENSPVLTSRGLGTVLGDLAALGFDARWGVVSAADVGAPQLRERIWIMAYRHSNSQSTGAINAGSLQKTNLDDSNGVGCGKQNILSEQPRGAKVISAGKDIPNTSSAGLERQRTFASRIGEELNNFCNISWWESEPNVGRVANGVAARVDRLKAIGNGQVPGVAATAWRILSAP